MRIDNDIGEYQNVYVSFERLYNVSKCTLYNVQCIHCIQCTYESISHLNTDRL